MLILLYVNIEKVTEEQASELVILLGNADFELAAVELMYPVACFEFIYTPKNPGGKYN